MVFTSLFSLEMLLKVLALGLFGYIKNPYNGFDSVIVIIRWGRRPLCPCVYPKAGMSVVKIFLPSVEGPRSESAPQSHPPDCHRNAAAGTDAVALPVQRARSHSIM